MVKRIEIAELLERTLHEAEWKGDKEMCGVWFTDDRGYVLNKILGIQIKHVQRAPDVFYSFWQSTENQVQLDYPFLQMKKTPKKHHIIYDETEAEELPNIFCFPDDYTHLKINIQPLVQFIENTLETKQLRDRSVCEWNIGDEVICTLKKLEKGGTKVYGNAKVEAEYNSCKKIQQLVKLNTATLYACLGLFHVNTKVDFYIVHDRMRINGTSLAGNEIEVIMAQIK